MAWYFHYPPRHPRLALHDQILFLHNLGSRGNILVIRYPCVLFGAKSSILMLLGDLVATVMT